MKEELAKFASDAVLNKLGIKANRVDDTRKHYPIVHLPLKYLDANNLIKLRKQLGVEVEAFITPTKRYKELGKKLRDDHKLAEAGIKVIRNYALCGTLGEYYDKPIIKGYQLQHIPEDLPKVYLDEGFGKVNGRKDWLITAREKGVKQLFAKEYVEVAPNKYESTGKYKEVDFMDATYVVRKGVSKGEIAAKKYQPKVYTENLFSFDRELIDGFTSHKFSDWAYALATEPNSEYRDQEKKALEDIKSLYFYHPVVENYMRNLFEQNLKYVGDQAVVTDFDEALEIVMQGDTCIDKFPIEDILPPHVQAGQLAEPVDSYGDVTYFEDVVHKIKK